MKLSFVFLTLLAGSVFASKTYSQKTFFSLDLKNSSVEEVFEEIENASEYIFFYLDNSVDLDRKVSIDIKNKRVEDILNKLFEGTNNGYHISDDQILIARKESKELEKAVMQQVKQKISGVIVDIDNNPIIGANVVVKGTTIGIVTDIDGRFSLDVPQKSLIEVTYIGYVAQEFRVSKKNKTISIKLLEDAGALEELVVVGFGKQKKASVVGAVQVIKPSELRVPTTNLSNAFSGRIAGVVSVQRSGEPGADGSSFWIRGISTFSKATSPLIFIDGVEVSADDMNALSPEVIESFSVLKDASATALYGARGANGVMLITTREGQDMERVKINIRIENSFTNPIKLPQLAGGLDYMRGYNEAIAYRTPGSPARFSDEKIENTAAGINPLLFPNVNWQETLFKEGSTAQAANLNVTGGGKKVGYFISASMNNDIGILKKDPFNNFDNNVKALRFSLQANVTAKLTSTTKVIVRLNQQIKQRTGSSSSVGDIFNSTFNTTPVLFQPVLPQLNGEDHILFGNMRGGPHPSSSGDNIYTNPYAKMVSGYNDRNESVSIATLEARQDLSMLTEGLSVQGLISFKNYATTTLTRSFTPFYYAIENMKANPSVEGGYDYDMNVVSKGQTALGFKTSSGGDRLMNIQFRMNYARQFGLHDIGAMAVYLQRDYNSNNPENFYTSLATRNQGLAGRFTYGYDNRYLVETNFGYNGSENFEKEHRFGFFPSIALGYNIANEAYFESLSDVISILKVRGSYGLVGNSSTDSRFPYLTEVNLSGKGYTFGDMWQTSKKGATITKYGAAGAEWEIGRKTNVGLDLEIMRALMVNVDFFHEDRSGIFMQRRVVPAESGVVGERPYANLGRVRNEGFDISLNYDKAFSKDLILNVRGSVTYSQNTLLDRDEPQLKYDYLSEIGKPLNRAWGLVADGLYTAEDIISIESGDIAKPTYGPFQEGDIKYVDMNEDGKIDDLDRTQIGDPTIPQLVWGLGASLQYKKIDFSLFFQGIGKTSMMMSNVHPYMPESSGLFQFIQEDRFQIEKKNYDAKYPALVHGTGAHHNFRNSTYWLRDASFFRLKNVEVGYTFKFMRIYVSGQNLLTFSPFDLWDPETGGGNGMNYPVNRIVNIGAQLTF